LPFFFFGAVDVVDVFVGEPVVAVVDVLVVVVLDVVPVVVVVEPRSADAWCSAVVAAFAESADGRSFLIAWPRLSSSGVSPKCVVGGVVPVVLPAVVPVVGFPTIGRMAVIACLRSANGMWRFCETCRAAMNWPWFLKPIDAWFSVIPVGSRPFTFLVSDDFDAIFCAIGFSCAGGVVVVVVPGVVPVVFDVVLPAVEPVVLPVVVPVVGDPLGVVDVFLCVLPCVFVVVVFAGLPCVAVVVFGPP